MDKAVNAVFAALIWHCQDLREELAHDSPSPHQPSQLMQDAFSTAEALRRELVCRPKANATVIHLLVMDTGCVGGVKTEDVRS